MPMRTHTPINADRGAGGSGYLVEDRRATARSQRSRHRDVGAELRQVGLRSGKHASKKDGDVEAAPDGFKHIRLTLLANGSTSRVSTVKFDGKDHPIAGRPGYGRREAHRCPDGGTQWQSRWKDCGNGDTHRLG